VDVAPRRGPHRRRLGLTAAGTSTLGVGVAVAAATPAAAVLAQLQSNPGGLDAAEAARRLAAGGPNAVRTHHAQALRVLGRQLRSPVLVLLAVTAALSYVLGQRTDTVVIGVILLGSIGLGFVNEYRAERATDALHSSVTHDCTVLRAGAAVSTDVTALVPGDVVRLVLGEVVPADLRLLEATALQCDESIITGESLPADKSTGAVAAGAALGDLTCAALMGTVVQAGTGVGVVVATGARAEFGRIAVALGTRQPETDFQAGLRRFSVLLLQVAVALTSLILVTNLLLSRPLIQSVLFSLAIAVGITPQLLPAVVSTSLATGSRRLARRRVLVKRLVCIEDLGDMDILVTDKTGTLTEGHITFTASLGPDGQPAPEPLRLGLLCTDGQHGGVGANPLDAALWAAAPGGAPGAPVERMGLLPFDHTRQMTSVVVRAGDGGRAADPLRSREPRRCGGQPQRRRSERARSDRRARPHPRRLPGVPRRPQTRRRGLAAAAGGARDHRQGLHGGQPPGRGEGLRRPRAGLRRHADREPAGSTG